MALTLLKEVFTDICIEQIDQNISFVGEATDMTEFVENNTLHLAEAGIDPEVLINNTSYPIAVVPRTDVPLEIALDTADTINTVVRNLEKTLTNSKKVESVTKRHAQAIINKMAEFASFNYSPSTNGLYTPVLKSTGTDNGAGSKLLLEDDILRLARAYDEIDAPEGERILVLHTSHFAELIKTSEILRDQQKYQGIQGVIGREIYNIYGFKVYKYRGKAVYNKTNGTKKAFNAVAAPTTDTISSFSFVKGEVMRALGTLTPFITLADNRERGDILGFQQRFGAYSIRNKFSGAIISDGV